MNDILAKSEPVLKWAALVPLVPAFAALFISHQQTATIEKVHWTELAVLFIMASLWLQGLRLLRTAFWLGVVTLTMASAIAGFGLAVLLR